MAVSLRQSKITGPGQWDWWYERAIGKLPWYAERSLLSNLICAGWLMSYLAIVWMATSSQSSLPLVFVATMLTSEGFVSTTVMFSSWATNFGTSLFKSLLGVIDDEFGYGKNPSALASLQAVAHSRKDSLEDHYNHFAPLWALARSSYLGEFRDACKALAVKYTEIALPKESTSGSES